MCITITYVIDKIEELVDKIDDYLGVLEMNGKDNTSKYDELFEISCQLHEIID